MLSHRKGVLLDGIGSELVRASTGGARKTLSAWLGDFNAELGAFYAVAASGDTTGATDTTAIHHGSGLFPIAGSGFSFE